MKSAVEIVLLITATINTKAYALLKKSNLFIITYNRYISRRIIIFLRTMQL